ncbi:hypothetical protein J6590_090705 [Homalodisca vitripennis]|nr:hypothetical protein J6590_090705 [Homalodisca vitripennis]
MRPFGGGELPNAGGARVYKLAKTMNHQLSDTPRDQGLRLKLACCPVEIEAKQLVHISVGIGVVKQTPSN